MGYALSFTSLGCARNLVDTEVMLAILLKNGYEVARDPEDADYHIINTCGFLEAARQEALDTLDAIFQRKKESSKVIVTGCMVALHKEMLLERFPKIHYFLGSGSIDRILEAVRSEEPGGETTSAKSFLQQGDVPRMTSTPSHYAYLKIAEGCKKRCAFCIIPKIKGPLKSKRIEQVVAEFQALLNSGVKEIILIAQDLGDFGKERSFDGELVPLLQKLLEEKRPFWLRLLYLYPDEVTPELVELMKSDRRLLPYLDMPIQHVNDTILKRMFRKTSKKELEATLSLLRHELKGVVIRTSIMCGFPGETEEQFEELMNFLSEQQLDNVGFFSYSNEELAHSSQYEDQIPESIKKARLEKISLHQAKIAKKRAESYVGKELEVLIDGPHPESPFLWVARFYGQCPEIDGCILINRGQEYAKPGIFGTVKITDSLDYDLLGTLLEPKQVDANPSNKAQKSRKSRSLRILEKVDLFNPHECDS